MFYVYFHRREDNWKIFYIGKGKGRRAWWRNGRNNHWHSVVNKYGYVVEIYKEGLTEKDAFDLEIQLIKNIGIDNLCNYTVGGDGASGIKKSESFKKYMREKMTGRKFSPETIIKMRENAMNRPIEQRKSQAEKIRGRKMSEEQKKKISEANKGRTISDETRKKISEYHKGKKKRPEAVEAMAASKSRRVLCVNNGIIYKSFREAGRQLNISSSKIGDVVNGKLKSTRGYTFEGVD